MITIMYIRATRKAATRITENNVLSIYFQHLDVTWLRQKHCWISLIQLLALDSNSVGSSLNTQGFSIKDSLGKVRL